MTETPGASQFAAVDATLGYLYQIHSALLWTLQRLRADPDFLVSVETLDDVTFETAGGEVTELLQTKHHRNSTASLTDASPDLWKTLRIWFEGHKSGEISQRTNLYLVTTGNASNDTAASRLRGEDRDVQRAQQALDATASSSTSKANRRAYEAYLSVSPARRATVLGKVVVIDASPTSLDLDDELRQEVYWATTKEYHEAFLDRLEGWWLRRVLRQLTDAPQDRIGSVELEAQMSDLREQFKQDALPIDDDLLEFKLDDATRAAHDRSTFVMQLQIIKAGNRRIAAAIRDYYRAFEQRSRWLREDLVIRLDLDKYEKRLVEEWELVFEGMRDELSDDAVDEIQERAARTVLQWAETATIAIRPNVTEPFVSRGSLHMLADDARIGWHPEFRDTLASLLGSGEGAA